MKKIFAFIVCVMLFISTCCAAEIGTAMTEVYVRRIEDGEIVGSLKKNDRVSVNSIVDGWVKISVGENEYKVWGEYLTIENSDSEEEVITEVSKSKSMEKKQKPVVSNKHSKKFKKNSEWSDIGIAMGW